MKHDYKIKVNPPLPTEEQMARHKDFSRVMQEYQKVTQPIYRRPLYKNPKAFLGLVLIFTIAFLVFEAVDEEEAAKKPSQQEQAGGAPALPDAIVLAEESSFLRPPVAALAPTWVSLALSSPKAQTLRLPGGIEASVPADAFPEGDGPVELRVRILRDPMDHVLAGLPLHTPDGMTIASSATVQLEATRHGQPVQPQKPINFRLPLPAGADAQPLDLIALDTRARAWQPNPSARKSAVTHIRTSAKLQDDGFGVVEFGPDGKAIQHTGKTLAKGKEASAQSFDLDALGVVALGAAERSAADRELPVRLTQGGKPLPVYALYRVGPGQLSGASFFWPQRADFSYTLRWSSAQLSDVFFGFLADGRVVQVKAEELAKLKAPGAEGAAIEARVSATPPKDKAALMQLLGI